VSSLTMGYTDSATMSTVNSNCGKRWLKYEHCKCVKDLTLQWQWPVSSKRALCMIVHVSFEWVNDLHLHIFQAKLPVILLCYFISFVHGMCCDFLLSLWNSIRLDLIDIQAKVSCTLLYGTVTCLGLVSVTHVTLFLWTAAAIFLKGLHT
jgi:hypothetical protein